MIETEKAVTENNDMIVVGPQPELREIPAEILKILKKKRGRPVGSKNKPKKTSTPSEISLEVAK